MSVFRTVLAGFVLCFITLTGYAAEAPQPAEAVLKLMNREIVTMRADLAGASPTQRVERARKRIDLNEDADLALPIRAETLVIGQTKGYQIMLGHQPQFALLEGDVDTASGETLEELVKQTLARLEEVRKAHYEQRYWPSILEGVGLSLAATLICAALLWLLWRATRFVITMLDAVRAKYEDVSTTHIEWQEYAARLGMRILWLVRWVVVLALLYTWAAYVLARFPFTRPLGGRLGDFVFRLLEWLGNGVVGAVPGLVTIGVVFFITRSIVEVLGLFFSKVQTGRLEVPFLHAETVSATRQIVTVIVWGLGVAVAYPYIPGSSSDAFKGLSVMFGLMISLGSTGLMTQMMSGLVVIYSRALRKGDFVSVSGTEGIVVEIGALATKLVNMRNEEITIPNSVLIGNAIRNYSRLSESGGAVISTKVTIGYDTPWRQVHAMLTIAAEQTAGIQLEPKPFVLQRALSDFYVEYELFVHIDEPKRRFFILTDLHANIQDQFNEYGVQIMSPNFRSQPDQPVLSPRETWYAAPAQGPAGNPDERQF
jgi:small-conductance mechanosensitive channel